VNIGELFVTFLLAIVLNRVKMIFRYAVALLCIGSIFYEYLATLWLLIF